MVPGARGATPAQGSPRGAIRATQPEDFSGLAEEFSTWVAAKDAAVPQFVSLPLTAVLSPDDPLHELHIQRQDQIATLEAEARTEYHHRFRARVGLIIGPDIPDPETIRDFRKLAKQMQKLAGNARDAEAIAVAQGTPLSDDHLSHLMVSRDRTQLDLLNEKPLETLVDTQNRASFLAHYEALRDQLEEWETAIQEREAALAAVATLVPQVITAAGLDSPEYIPGELAECFTESVLGRLRRRDYTSPPLRLRCVETPMAQVRKAAARIGDPERRIPEEPWNAYVNAGVKEYLIRTVPGPVDFNQDGVAAHNETEVAPIEAELQSCYDAILHLPQVDRVKLAQARLKELGEPILEELKRQKISGAQPMFSSACPYCLAAIGI